MLREVPRGWEKVRLGDECDVLLGATPARKQAEYWDKDLETQNHWVSIADLTALSTRRICATKERISDLGVENSSVKLIEPGTPLISFKLSIGAVAIAGTHLYTNEAIAGIRPKRKNLRREFLYYALPDAVSSVIAHQAVKGATLNKGKLQSIRLLAPPLPEQKKIAAILASVDEAIEATEAVIEQTRRVKKGLLQELLTRGIGHTEFQETAIGEIPKEWEVKRLPEIASVLHGAAFPSSEYQDEGILLVRPGNLAATGMVRWDAAHTTYLAPRYASEKSKYLLEGEQILMNLTAQSLADGFLGRVCLSAPNAKFLLNQRIARISPKRLLDKHFLFWALAGPAFRRQVARMTTGSKVQHLYNKDLQAILLAVPSSTEEQKDIADVLNTFRDREHEAHREVESLQELKKGLLQDLLTGKVRVNVDEAAGEVRQAAEALAE